MTNVISEPSMKTYEGLVADSASSSALPRHNRRAWWGRDQEKCPVCTPLKVKLKAFQGKKVIAKTVQGMLIKIICSWICGDLSTNLGHTQGKTKAFIKTTERTNVNIPRTSRRHEKDFEGLHWQRVQFYQSKFDLNRKLNKIFNIQCI